MQNKYNYPNTSNPSTSGLIANPNTVWIEIPYNSKMDKDGLYVIDSENYLYTIIYNGEVVLSFS